MPLRILVTGSAGFIGFHLARRLLSDGHAVVGVDGMTPYYDVRLKEARHAQLAASPAFVEARLMLEDAAALNAIADRHQPEAVVHLAAQAGVRYSLENPRAYVDSNLVGTFNVMEIARRLGVGHLLIASTSSIYGANEAMPFVEIERADHPLTFYAATKKATELMTHSYSHLWNLPTTCFRFFTVYGPWGRPDMALFKFVQAMLKDESIEVYNQGRMERDFTYVGDLVEAIVRLIGVIPRRGESVGPEDSLSPVAPWRTVNIGCGQPMNLMAFIDEIELQLGVKARRRLLPMQPGDVPRTFADATLLDRLTGYRPTTPVSEGVAAFCDWYRLYHAEG